MRWSIHSIVYYSDHGKSRVLEFSPRGVTIITGCSNTGKTAIIKTIDYCLGASNCNIPAFVKERCVCVAIKFTNGNSELVVGRDVPTGKASASDVMYFSHGQFVALPKYHFELAGKMNVGSARSLLEQSFGIERVPQDGTSDRVSIRQSTAFIFLSKEVIDSERTLFHGLDDVYSGRHIIGAIPYFLGAVTEEGVVAGYRMAQLKHKINKELREKDRLGVIRRERYIDGKRLLAESITAGLTRPRAEDTSSEMDIIERLGKCIEWTPEEIDPDELGNDLYSVLLSKKLKLTASLKALNAEKRAAKDYAEAVNNFSDTVVEQFDKVKLISLFEGMDGVCNCPVCASRLESSSQMYDILKKLSPALDSQSGIARRYIPNLTKYIKDIEDKKTSIKLEIAEVDVQLNGVIAEMDKAQKVYTANQRASHVLGRISYFLEEIAKEENFDSSTLEALERELHDLEERFGVAEKKERLDQAQSLISQYATAFFQQLPKGEPCLNGNLFFDASKPSVSVVDHERDKRIKFSEIGSDENYLTIHLALSFALQKFFSEAKRPIPAILLMDQVSRPYYSPATPNDELGEIVVEEDSDGTALRQYFEFIFKQAKANPELQIIILEHAYLATLPEYRSATKYRWNKGDGEKLIPSDWPERAV